jgi:hypothetical protein
VKGWGLKKGEDRMGRIVLDPFFGLRLHQRSCKFGASPELDHQFEEIVSFGYKYTTSDSLKLSRCDFNLALVAKRIR